MQTKLFGFVVHKTYVFGFLVFHVFCIFWSALFVSHQKQLYFIWYCIYNSFLLSRSQHVSLLCYYWLVIPLTHLCACDGARTHWRRSELHGRLGQSRNVAITAIRPHWLLRLEHTALWMWLCTLSTTCWTGWNTFPHPHSPTPYKLYIYIYTCRNI